MNYEPDFKNVLEKANELLLQSNSINDFPFSAYKFTYEMSDAVLSKFSSIESENLSAETILGTKDASLIENNGRYLLFYNEKMSNQIQCYSWKYFGEKGKKGSASWIRQIFTKNPEAEAGRFYDLLTDGGTEKPLSNGHGFITTMPDGSKITIRIKTSSKDSPAVDLKLEGFHKGVKTHQKIHFVRLED